MTGELLAPRVLEALTHGDPMPLRADGLPITWAFDLAPGDNDGVDELHYTVELWVQAGEVIAGFSRRTASLTEDIGIRVLDEVQIAAVRDRWESLYYWPYNNELEGITP